MISQGDHNVVFPLFLSAIVIPKGNYRNTSLFDLKAYIPTREERTKNFWKSFLHDERFIRCRTL